MEVDASSSAVLESVKPQDAFHAIRTTERLFVHLGLRDVEFEAADEALEVARAFYTANDHTAAVAQARRAEALALSLNERFNAYVATWKGLQKSIEELEHLGFPTEAIEAAIEEAEKAMISQVEEEGTLVPDYLGATAWLERAMADARAAMVGAKRGSREIFLATLALESLREAQPSEATAHLATRLEGLIEQATRELACGQVSASFKLAAEARGQADGVLAHGTELLELGVETDSVLQNLTKTAPDVGRSEVEFTVLAGALGRELRLAPPWKSPPREATRVPPSPTDKIERAKSLLGRVERSFAQLKDEGFFSLEVDEALTEARRAVEMRDWPRVRGCVGRASRALVARRNERSAVGRMVAELDERVGLLGDFELPFLPEVRQLLERAKEELQGGRLSDASDFIVCANELMRRATRAGS